MDTTGIRKALVDYSVVVPQGGAAREAQTFNHRTHFPSSHIFLDRLLHDKLHDVPCIMRMLATPHMTRLQVHEARVMGALNHLATPLKVILHSIFGEVSVF